MSKTVYDTHHTCIVLGNELARGGEAVIYFVLSHPDLLAKIYTKSLANYEQKLIRMAANPPVDPTQPQHISIAWIQDLLYEADGKFAGLLIPRIHQAVPILDIFTPQVRTQTLPNFNRVYLHRTARNLALALDAVHTRGYVVGDLNESNILVTPQALVTLIDTDSFQVQERHPSSIITYPCPVGKGTYTPPELQHTSFPDTIRSPEHDRFGLGVLIFQLLMEGNHPFRAQWRGAGTQPTLLEKIEQGLFPHTKPSNRAVAPPPDAPLLEILGPGVANLMVRCFVDGHQDARKRPTAQEWASMLATAEQQLVECCKGHYFARYLLTCPQCGTTRQLRGFARNLFVLFFSLVLSFFAIFGFVSGAIAGYLLKIPEHNKGKIMFFIVIPCCIEVALIAGLLLLMDFRIFRIPSDTRASILAESLLLSMAVSFAGMFLLAFSDNFFLFSVGMSSTIIILEFIFAYYSSEDTIMNYIRHSL